MQNNIAIVDSEKEIDIIEELIMETYCKLFTENKAVKRYVPSTRELFDRLCYDVEVRALDIIYGIQKSDISEDGISSVLVNQKCVFRWGGVICQAAQQIMFDELYEEEVGLFLDV